MYAEASICLSVGVSDYGAKCQLHKPSANKNTAPTKAATNNSGVPNNNSFIMAHMLLHFFNNQPFHSNLESLDAA